jgi:hypothetical protein
MSNALVSIDPDDERGDERLSDREEQFVYAYVNFGFNKSRAYKYISPGVLDFSAQTLGSQMYARARVQARISELVAQNAMTAAEVICEIGNVARASIGDVLEYLPEHQMVIFDPDKAFTSGAIHHMKRFSKNQDGTVTIQMHDKMAALTLLAKLHGLLSDAEGDGQGTLLPTQFYLPKNPRDEE